MHVEKKIIQGSLHQHLVHLWTDGVIVGICIICDNKLFKVPVYLTICRIEMKFKFFFEVITMIQIIIYCTLFLTRSPVFNSCPVLLRTYVKLTRSRFVKIFGCWLAVPSPPLFYAKFGPHTFRLHSCSEAIWKLSIVHFKFRVLVTI